MFKHKKYLGVPCPDGCVDIPGPKRLPITNKNPFELVSQIKEYYIGNDAADKYVRILILIGLRNNCLFIYYHFSGKGCYCIDIPFAKHCPYSDVT